MAVRFSTGTDEYTASTGLPTSNIWTVTWWAQCVVDLNDFSCIFSVGVGGLYVDVSTGSDGTTLGVYDPATYASTPLGATALTVGTWYRMGLVVNGTSASFYRADVATATLTVSTASGDFTATNPPLGLAIGDSVNFGDYPFSGRIAAWKMWNAALTQAEVEAELVQYQPRRTANILRFHPFIKTEAVDYSGNGNTLSGSGSTTEDGPPIPWTAQVERIIIPTATSTDYVKTVTDSVGVVDSATRTMADTRAINDVVGLLDSASRTAVDTRVTTDSVGVVDVVTRVMSDARTLTNPVGILDSTARATVITRTTTDPIGIVDSRATAQVLARTVTDGVGVLDSSSDGLGEGSTSPIGVVDSTTDVWTLSRATTSAEGITDTAADTWQIARTVTDTVGLVDDASGSLGGFSRIVTDTVGTADGVTRTVMDVRTQSDPTGVTDSRVTALTAVQVITNPVALLDSVTKSAGQTRIDPVGIADSVTQVQGGQVTLTDALGLLDGVVHFGSQARVLINSVGIDDDVTGAITGPQTGIRIRVSGREPFGGPLAGNEPISKISGMEVASP